MGGGIGHLTPSYGLTLDNLLSATVVAADGSVLSANENENAELFWALRGGGGNFGVVVDFTFQLHRVGLLLGGSLDYRIEDAPVVLSRWRDVMANAPPGELRAGLPRRRHRGRACQRVNCLGRRPGVGA